MYYIIARAVRLLHKAVVHAGAVCGSPVQPSGKRRRKKAPSVLHRRRVAKAAWVSTRLVPEKASQAEFAFKGDSVGNACGIQAARFSCGGTISHT